MNEIEQKDKVHSRREWYLIGYKDATREMQEELKQASELKAETIKLAKQETAREILHALIEKAKLNGVKNPLMGVRVTWREVEEIAKQHGVEEE